MGTILRIKSLIVRPEGKKFLQDIETECCFFFLLFSSPTFFCGIYYIQAQIYQTAGPRLGSCREEVLFFGGIILYSATHARASLSSVGRVLVVRAPYSFQRIL